MEQPKFPLPELPDDITLLDDQDLMRLFGKFEKWCTFYDHRLFDSRDEEEEAGILRDRAEADALLNASSEKNVTLTKARALVSPIFINADNKYHSLQVTRKHYESQLKITERRYWFCSKELGRRTQPKRPEKSHDYGWGQNGKGHLSD